MITNASSPVLQPATQSEAGAGAAGAGRRPRAGGSRAVGGREGGAGGVAETGGGGSKDTHSGAASLGLKGSESVDCHVKKLPPWVEPVACRLGVSWKSVVLACAGHEVPDHPTDAEVEKIVALVESVMVAAQEPVPAPATATQAGVVDELIVTRLHGPRRVLADRASTGREVVCCLKASANLKAGMRLTGAYEGEGGLWFYIGRLPRGKGRW